MLKPIVEAAISNLKQAELICTGLSIDVYTNKSVGPYYSSIGGHLRHILDVFQCIFNGLESEVIDLTDRKRGTVIEEDPKEGLKYLNKVILELENLTNFNAEIPAVIKDDLGNGMVEFPTTLAGGINQAHSHAIHHFACIGYILYACKVKLPNKVFGYNPTTPQHRSD